MVVAVGGVGEASPDVLKRQFGELLDDLHIGHASGEPAENVINRDAHPADTRASTAFAGFDRDDFSVVHTVTLRHSGAWSKACESQAVACIEPRKGCMPTTCQIICRSCNVPEGQWKLAGGGAQREPPDHGGSKIIRPGRGGGTLMHAAFQRPAGAHPCGTLIRWFPLAARPHRYAKRFGRALAPPPAHFRAASGVQKRTARSGTQRVLLRVERAERLGDENE